MVLGRCYICGSVVPVHPVKKRGPLKVVLFFVPHKKTLKARTCYGSGRIASVNGTDGLKP